MGGTELTERLYCADPYQKEFSARVLEISGNEVVLDKTCFYPEGGGQAGDTGTIGGVKVANTIKVGSEILKVGEDEIPIGGKIIHVLESAPAFAVGDVVACAIDWEKRHKTMRLHAASHIMEHFLFKVFGNLSRLGSKVDWQKDRGTYGSEKKFGPEDLKKAEEMTNEFISRNLEIRTGPSEENPLLRLWQCEELKMYCGGTHVRNTGEIGKIRMKRSTKGAGKEFVETFLVE
ncbi:MAG: alanyl-tRNA editing protein [archaeon]